MHTQFADVLQHEHIPAGLYDWARGLTLGQAWDTFPRAEWGLWILDALGYAWPDAARLYACHCVRQRWDLVTDAGRHAIETAEAYAYPSGGALDDDLRAAWLSVRDDPWNAPIRDAADVAWAVCGAVSFHYHGFNTTDAVNVEASCFHGFQLSEAFQNAQAEFVRRVVPRDGLLALGETYHPAIL
jgi:hypothetical protein